MLPTDINCIIIEYIGYSDKLQDAGWTDNDLVNFYKNYELDVLKCHDIDYKKFKKLINVNDLKYIQDGLHTIKFENDFNQPVILPAGLHTVIFGFGFNQLIILPTSLHTIRFGFGFDFNQ